MSTHLPITCLLAAVLPCAAQGFAEPLFQWPFAEGSGAVAHDVSGNGLNGTVTAAWQTDDTGSVLFFNGTAATQVTIDLPESTRLGAGSWTVSAWIKPTRLGMPDSPEGQNARRMFSYGKWPEAIITLNIGGNGTFGCFMSYRDVNGVRIDGSATSAAHALEVGRWAHVVMVCDRENRQLRPYVNSVRQGARRLPDNFAADFDVFGNLSVGNGWQNYWGHMGPVTVYRRALTTADVIRLFRDQGERFGAAGDTALSARERDALEAAVREDARHQAEVRFATLNEAATQAWAAGDVAGARARLHDIIDDETMAPHSRSFAHLRLALAYAAEGRMPDARAEYARLAAAEAYPAVHRTEARERLIEFDRVAQGLPARDPAAGRTKLNMRQEFAADIHVAPAGDDGGDGSGQRPFRTLARARDAVRVLKEGGLAGAVCVHIHPGEYAVTETLALTSADSGTVDAPVVYRAEPLGQAVFYGGARVTGFTHVTAPDVLARLPEAARGMVWQADLRAQGITDYGELRVRGGIGQPPAPPTLEVFVDGQPGTLARWPNEGFVSIRELLEPGSAREGKASVFGYVDDRHARWKNAREPWLRGYWHFLWADATIQVATIDTEARTITTVKPYNYGGRGMSNHQGIIYYAFNLLEEIDQPGEWYLERETGMLYLYAAGDPARSTVEIGMHAGPMVTFDGVSHVHLEGLVFDLARYNGIQIANSSHCRIAGCTVTRMAATGITVHGGADVGIFGCDLHSLGRRGIEISGGNRETLQPAGHVVENCRIHDVGRIDRTYTQTVTVGGVGNRLSHNLMYDCPTSVISLGGNDHVIEYNDVHSAVQESDDQGAIDMWGNPTFRGNIFRYNRFRSVGKTGSEHAAHGQAAIRFDDTISGQLVYGNILYRSSNGNFGAVQMNCGRDNIFDNNMFLDSRHAISGGWHPGNAHWTETREGRKDGAYTTELYLQRYPAIAGMFDENGQNFFWRNIFWRCGTIDSRARHLEMVGNAILSWDDGVSVVDVAAGDVRLQADAPVIARIAFRPIPVEQIGLYAHALRASWPVVTTPVAKADWRPGFEQAREASGVMPHALNLNPIRVARVTATPTVDGHVGIGEWPADPLQLDETPERKPVTGPAAQAWLMHDREMLYVAVRVPIAGETARLRTRAGQWGEADGAEICLRDLEKGGAGGRSPTLILQGYPDGTLEGATNPAEATRREVSQLARLSRFAATVGTEAWVSEWAIPMAALGVAYEPGLRLQFNIGVRRTAPHEWVALAGALGPNWKLDNAAVIVME